MFPGGKTLRIHRRLGALRRHSALHRFTVHRTAEQCDQEYIRDCHPDERSGRHLPAQRWRDT